MEPIQITPGAEEGLKDSAINQNFRDVASRLKRNIIKDSSGDDTLIIGSLPDGGHGIIVKGEGGTNRAIFGQDKNGSIAIKISEQGVDVQEATNDQLIFNATFEEEGEEEDNSLMTLLHSDTVTFPALAAAPGDSVGTHNSVDYSTPLNLDYAPIGLVFRRIGVGNSKDRLPYISSKMLGDSGGVLEFHYDFTITRESNGDITLTVFGSNYKTAQGQGEIDMEYYLFKPPSV